MSTVSFFGSQVSVRYGVRTYVLYRVATIASGLCVFGTGAAAYCTSLTSFTFCFGLLFGLGAGFANTIPYQASWGHYPENKARVTGLLMASFGYSSSIFGLVTTYIVNPDNLLATVKEVQGAVVSYYFTEEVALRAPTMMLWLAGIFFVLSVCGVLSISEKPRRTVETIVEEQVVVKSGLCSIRFWTLSLACFLSVALSMYVGVAFKTYGNGFIRDDKYLTFVGSISALINATSRFLWAEAAQRYSFKTVYVLLLLIQTLFSSTLYAFARTEGLYMLYMCVIFTCRGGHFVLFPSVLGRMYGAYAGAALYSILYIGISLSALAGFMLQKFAINDIGYEYVFFILTSTAVLSLLLIIPFDERFLGTELKQDMERLIDTPT